MFVRIGLCNLLGQMCSILNADSLGGLHITVFFNLESLRQDEISHYFVLWVIVEEFTRIYKAAFPIVWHWKQSLCNQKNMCLAVTYQVTQSFWLCKQKPQEVSWHCTFKRRKTFNTKISLHNTYRICPCLPVSCVPPLIVVPCENVYSAFHSSQPAQSLIKHALWGLIFNQFKSGVDFDSLPSGFSGVPLYSFEIEISLDLGLREQVLGEC